MVTVVEAGAVGQQEFDDVGVTGRGGPVQRRLLEVGRTGHLIGIARQDRPRRLEIAVHGRLVQILPHATPITRLWRKGRPQPPPGLVSLSGIGGAPDGRGADGSRRKLATSAQTVAACRSTSSR